MNLKYRAVFNQKREYEYISNGKINDFYKFGKIKEVND